MIANIALDDALILPHRANPTGLNFRERQRFETAISAAVKSGPQHRTGIKPSALKKTVRPKRR